MRGASAILGATIVALALAVPAGAQADARLEPPFSWPAQGTVTSPFGTRGGGFHPGIDIGMLRSLVVRAASSGRVVLVGQPVGFEGYGTLVGIDLGDGYLTLYAHLVRAQVRLGDFVQQGEPIAVAGCTGSCSGTHLHFELRRDGRPIDPMAFFAPRLESGGQGG